MKTRKKTTLKHKRKILRNLNALLASCREGESGEWDASTDEGKEGFDAMADDLHEVAKLLGLELTEPESFYTDEIEEEVA